tara:strand:- start:543 stop:1295 length:753 start_codon:yes stop_codon:yes gene_type:complete
MKAKNLVLITGCNGGVGSVLCRRFKGAGFFVIGTDFQPKSISGPDTYLQCDLEKFSQDEELQEEFRSWVLGIVGDQAGRLKALINNAAYQVVAELKELSVREFGKSQYINLVAPFAMIRLFQDELRISEGSVVNIGSIHSKLTKPGFSAYSTSKAGLSAMTRALAVELGSELRINTVVPAAIRTEMLAAGFGNEADKLAQLEKYHPAGRIAEPDEIADISLFLCSDKAGFINGAEISVDGAIGGRLHDPS